MTKKQNQLLRKLIRSEVTRENARIAPKLGQLFHRKAVDQTMKYINELYQLDLELKKAGK